MKSTAENVDEAVRELPDANKVASFFSLKHQKSLKVIIEIKDFSVSRNQRIYGLITLKWFSQSHTGRTAPLGEPFNRYFISYPCSMLILVNK